MKILVALAILFVVAQISAISSLNLQSTYHDNNKMTASAAAAAGGIGTGDLSTTTTTNDEEDKDQLEQRPYQHVKDIAVMVRSYHMDRWKASASIFASMEMFFDTSQFDFKLILDDESKGDHMWGACLTPEYPFMDIQYEANPENWEELFHGIAFAKHARYARPGYDRQQWSTFYMDKYAENNHEIIGVIDADGCFYTHMTRENILTPDGRILLRVGNGTSHYENDKVALGFDEKVYEFMYLNRMPIFFWKSTYENARAHIAKRYNTTFDEAFKQFSLRRYSQFNIIANYALKFEADRYDFKFHTDLEGVVSFGSNYCQRGSVVTGCCAAFDIPNCAGPPAPEIMKKVFLSYNTYPVSWIGNMTLVTDHFENVKRDLSALGKRDPEAIDKMKYKCYLYMTKRTTSVCTDIGNTTEAA